MRTAPCDVRPPHGGRIARNASHAWLMKHDVLILPDSCSCLLEQAGRAEELAGLDGEAHARLLLDVLTRIGDNRQRAILPLEEAIQRLVRQHCGGDPYAGIKRESTLKALALYPRLQEMVHRSAHPFETALRVAIAGNIIDVATHPHYDLEASLEQAASLPLAIDDSMQLAGRLEKASSILYLADNAGESVFDRC